MPKPQCLHPTRHAVERITMLVAMMKRPQGMSISRACEELEVSSKTIWRDLEFMRDRLQIPATYAPEEFVWRLDKTVRVPWFWK
jgi:predicted DNA-binding transcriptional regulator YafY